MTKYILACGDEHVLFRRKGVPAEFEEHRYNRLFQSILDRTFDEPDCLAVVHLGDMFDRQPTIREIGCVVAYLNSVNVKTFLIDGNHEATKKGETFLSELNKMVTNPLVDIISCESYEYLGKDDEYRIDFLPYCKLKAFEKNGNDKFENNILVTHVRGEIPPHVTPEVDLSIFDKWRLVLAGDLHSHSNSQRNIVYPGSPLTTSFYRTKPKKGILKVDLDTLGVEFIDLNLPALIKLTVESKDEIIENTTEDFLAYDIVPKVEAIIEAKEDTVFHKEASREDAILAVLDAEESKKKEVIDLYVNIIRGRS